MVNQPPRIAIIDLEINNLFSIQKALESFKCSTFITSNSKEISNADAIVLPGVGSYAKAMRALRKKNLINPIIKFAESDKYILGICLGMQLLMDSSEEFGINDGLGLINGVCKRFDDSRYKVPHIMWNRIKFNRLKHFIKKSPIGDKEDGELMYFIHSYYVKPKNESSVLTYTSYENFKFCSAVQEDKIIGFQFHPEKSSEKGIQILNNSVNLVKNDKK